MPARCRSSGAAWRASNVWVLPLLVVIACEPEPTCDDVLDQYINCWSNSMASERVEAALEWVVTRCPYDPEAKPQCWHDAFDDGNCRDSAEVEATIDAVNACTE